MTSQEVSASANSGLTRPLADIAAEINRHHSEATRHSRTDPEHSRLCGESLIAAKRLVDHGDWLPWLDEHCYSLSPRQCQRYMRLAWTMPATTDGVSHLRNKETDVSHLGAVSHLRICEAPTSHLQNAQPVSHLTDQAERDAMIVERLESLPAGMKLYADAEHGYAEIFRSREPEPPGWYLLIFNWSRDGGVSANWERPAPVALVPLMIRSRLLGGVEFAETADDGSAHQSLVSRRSRPSHRAPWDETLKMGFRGIAPLVKLENNKKTAADQ